MKKILLVANCISIFFYLLAFYRTIVVIIINIVTGKPFDWKNIGITIILGLITGVLFLGTMSYFGNKKKSTK
jgi:hypothetical protein